MKAAFKTLLCVAMVLAVAVGVRAEDEKPKAGAAKTLKGELGCAKCVFKVEGITKCTNAIKVKEGGKETIYIFLDKGAKEPYHKKICTSSANGSVKGKVSKKGDQNYVTPAKDGVKYDD